MPAVKYIDQAQAEVQEVYNNAEDFFGHVPNLVKALGSNPRLCASITNCMIQSLGEGRIDWALK